MTTSTHAQASPYTGPRPFSRRERDHFFARERETDSITSLIIAHSVVLLYGTAGTGKSSLLNAQLLPKLEEEEGCRILPPARFYRPINDWTQYSKIENIYVFNTLLSLGAENIDADNLASMTLAAYLKRRIDTDNQSDDDGQKDRVPYIVVFDQMEELFKSYPERRKERRGFFEQIADALDDASLKRILRVLFCLREDSLGDMESFAYILPGQLRARFRLERLRKKAALRAIAEPARLHGRHFENGAAEELAENLIETFAVKSSSGEVAQVKGQFIDPLQLQIVCQNLWRSLNSNELQITRERVQASGDVGKALEGFYEKAIRDAERKTEVSEHLLRRWIERELITAEGTRAVTVKGVDKTSGIDNRALETLEASHLIRSESRGGTYLYELIHDRFIDVIQESNTKWRMQNGDERLRAELEERAERWLCEDRSKQLLLDRSEMADAEKWIGSHDLDASPNMISLIEASRRAHRERSLRVAMGLSVAMLTLIALMTVAIFWVLGQRQAAVRAREEALKAQAAAVTSAGEAETEKERAVRALKGERKATEIAEQERKNAVKQKQIAEKIAKINKELARLAEARALQSSMAASKAEEAAEEARRQGQLAIEAAEEAGILKQQAEAERLRADETATRLEEQLKQGKDLQALREQEQANYWRVIESQSNPELFYQYIKLYPNGRFTEEAKRRMGDSVPELLPNTGAIIGMLEDNNIPIVGATVGARDAAGHESFVLTNINGGYTLSLPPGSYTIMVSHRDYERDTKKVEIKAGEKQVITGLTLKRIR